ncbi:MAG: gas vesicle protein [bacterium]
MEPTRDTQVTLVDVLDRVLDKGLVINADIIISVAGIPLIGVNLRAALAGMETMLKYGVMKAWDEKIREWEGDNRISAEGGSASGGKKEVPLIQREEPKEKLLDFLTEGELVTHQDKAWHVVSSDGIWRPGHLYITNKRLCWWYNFEKRLAFEVSTEKILGSAIEIRNLNPLLKKKKIFDIIYEGNSERPKGVPGEVEGRKVASFSGEGMYEWERALGRIISFRERIESCPQCGRTANALELLDKGCANCGWVSPRLKKIAEVAT